MIRTLQLQDIPELQRIGTEAWMQYRSLMSDEEWQRLWVSVRGPESYQKFLATAKGFGYCDPAGTLLGMAYLEPSGSGDEVYDAQWCRLRFVSVHPNARGKGVARALVQRCIAEAQQAGETIMALHTSEHMQAAQHVYTQLGFQRLREIPPRFGMRYYLYTLNLNEGPDTLTP